MKKIFMMMFLGLIIVSMIGGVGAVTYVVGQTFDSETGLGIEGVNVTVLCNHSEQHMNYASGISDSDGIYKISYSERNNDGCDNGDYVTLIDAIKEGYEIDYIIGGNEPREVRENYLDEVDFVLINIAMVPEFGLFIGILTLFGAIGVFFFVRR